MLAEKQIVRSDQPLGSGFAEVVHIHPATFNIFSACPLDGHKPAWTSTSTSAQPVPASLAFSMVVVGTSPTISLNVDSPMPSNDPPNKISLARWASAVAAAVDQIRHRFGQGAMGDAPPDWPFVVPPRPDFLLVQEGENFRYRITSRSSVLIQN